jgi:NAD(P)-dependent dehydrogenase (short-subunit alcohol dehydrogenase family)
MPFIHSTDAPIVIVGGSGLIGRALAPLLAQQEGRPLVLTGRSAERARLALDAVQAAGGRARFEPFTIGADTDATLPACAIVGLVTDERDLLLSSAVSAGIPFVDITRWTSHVASSAARLWLRPPAAPVVLSSGWMGGLLPRAAATLAHELGEQLDRVEGSIRYAVADATGADSVDYMERMCLPFEATRERRRVIVHPFSEPRSVRIGGQRTAVRRQDTPEQWSLPLTMDVATAEVRIGFDNALAGSALAMLAQIGFFRWFNAEGFRRMRHALLRSSGAHLRKGARAAFRVDVRGQSGATSSLCLATDAGQAWLTGVGAWLSLRWALDPATPASVLFPESDPANSMLAALLGRAGVSVLRESER